MSPCKTRLLFSWIIVCEIAHAADRTMGHVVIVGYERTEKVRKDSRVPTSKPEKWFLDGVVPLSAEHLGDILLGRMVKGIEVSLEVLVKHLDMCRECFGW